MSGFRKSSPVSLDQHTLATRSKLFLHTGNKEFGGYGGGCAKMLFMRGHNPHLIEQPATAITGAAGDQIKLWLDDVRLPPDESWTWAKTIDQAKPLLETGRVTEASLDNDLGEDAEGHSLPEGRKLVLWMAEFDKWPSERLRVHSSNTVAVDYMNGMIKRYGPYGPPRRSGNGLVFNAS